MIIRDFEITPCTMRKEDPSWRFALAASPVTDGQVLRIVSDDGCEGFGYASAVPLGTLDLGVDGGRSLVDIPIIGPCEAMFHVAAQLGDRFGVICYHESVIPRQITQTRLYGMEPWIAGRRASGFKLKDIGANKNVMMKNFVAAGRSLIEEDGADVIIVHGITQCPVHMKPDWLSNELGVPVVEGIGAPIRMAAMLAGLGLKHSRKRWPKSSARPNV